MENLINGGYKNSFSKGELARELTFMNRDNDKYKEIIDKATKIIKEYKECNWSKYDENEIEIELIDKILEILEDKEVE